MNMINLQMQADAAETTSKPRTVHWMGTTYVMQLTSEETAGSFGMYAAVCPPGSGPGVHVHHAEDEIFHILEGELEFWLDGRTFKAGAGRTVFLPRKVPHTFRVSSDTAARTLTMLTPGGFEGFFSAVASRGLTMPSDMAEIAEIASQFQLEFLAPPPWTR